MAGSTPREKAAQEKGAYHEYELNLEMWRHYDNLRQEKSKTFLTAQTILIAVSGFVFKSQDPNSALQVIILAISLLGLGSSLLWLLLLIRNAGYIQFHRERVKALEADAGIHFTTFRDEWCEFDKKLWPRNWSNKLTEFDKKLWPRSWSNRKDNGPLAKVFKALGSSTMIDRMLAALFGLFWLCLFGYGVWLV